MKQGTVKGLEVKYCKVIASHMANSMSNYYLCSYLKLCLYLYLYFYLPVLLGGFGACCGSFPKERLGVGIGALGVAGPLAATALADAAFVASRLRR
ncbi:hypothetical protein N7478_006899 [Penicillium angulare]|uniref:uncharacterized protein n=1 Tax=Penicillium angulare TaxID=116970 RepID=UPI002541523D|nr:uncharacterized protein N7478_006899 [Penicillium angulare]KAJ5281527.1 hypothetical protein N7478_006899 [Penicillium angulare]